MLLEELGDGEAAALDAPQRVEEQVAVEGALPLLRPHVDLLLMVGEGAVIPVLTVLLVNHVCKEATGHTFRQAGRQPTAPPVGPAEQEGGVGRGGEAELGESASQARPFFVLHLGVGPGSAPSRAKHGGRRGSTTPQGCLVWVRQDDRWEKGFVDVYKPFYHHYYYSAPGKYHWFRKAWALGSSRLGLGSCYS